MCDFYCLIEIFCRYFLIFKCRQKIFFARLNTLFVVICAAKSLKNWLSVKKVLSIVTWADLQTNLVSGKACSSTKGGLICLYMQPLLAPQTTEFVICISIYTRAPHRHITSPSEKSRPETWPGKHMGKATPVWQLTLSHR